MRNALIVLFLFTSITQAAAQKVMAFGIGQESCAFWLASRRNFDEGRTWISGYWTAANALNTTNHLVGAQTDANGLAAAVKAVCAKSPSRVLLEAVADAYAVYHTP